MPKILVTGANGQLGSELRRLAADFPGDVFHFTDVEELDITTPEAIRNYLGQYPVNYMLNCAAYTAVDLAEDEPEKVRQINVQAVENLGTVALENNIQLYHISTDYVFSGEKNLPYQETDAANPKSVYGRSKLEGEKVLMKLGTGMIIRTSWLYSVFGNNFVKTMLRLGKSRPELGVVFDQTGSPTYARDLAIMILEMIKFQEKRGMTRMHDVFHFSNEGYCSWYDFAAKIFELKKISCKLIPLRTSEYPVKAPRPRYTVMDKSKIRNMFAVSIPHWKDSLADCLKEIE